MLNGKQVIIAILVVTAAAMLFMTLIAWRRRAAAGSAAVYLALCMMAMALYNAGYALELSNTTLPEIMFWVRFQHWGIQAIAPTWLLFALCIAGKEKLITLPRIIALVSPAVLFFLAAQTLGGANLIHLNPRLNTAGPFPTFTYDRGLIAWLDVAYISACLALGVVIFAIMLLRAAPAFRPQAAVFLGGSSISWLGVLLYMFGLTPYNLDFSPFSLSLSALILAFSFLRFRLLDIIPLARDVVFEGLREGALVLDTNNRIIDFNLHLQTMLPDVRKTSVGFSVFEALSGYPALLELIKAGTIQTAELQVGHGGAIHHYQAKISPLLSRRAKVMGRLITLHDYTEMQQLLKQMEEIAALDDLTGAFNRRRFGELATREINRLQQQGGALALVMFDLDHYKTVNDTYGHAAGDMALKIVVAVCRSILRQSDILGRLGGDEFLILLPDSTLPAAARIAERLCSALEEHPMLHYERSFTVTGSFGYTGAIYPSHMSLEDLYRCADHAVYQAKDAGRNRVCMCEASADATGPRAPVSA